MRANAPSSVPLRETDIVTEPSDEQTLRAVISALGSGNPDEESAQAKAGAAGRAKPQLRVVANPAAGGPDTGPGAPGDEAGKRQEEAPAGAGGEDREARRRAPGDPAAPEPDAAPAATADAPVETTVEASVAASVAATVTAAGTEEGKGAAPRQPRLGPALRAIWQRWRPLTPYLLATLGPVPLLLLAAFLGGYWSLAALMWMTVFLHVADEIALRRGKTAPGAGADVATDGLPILLAVVHFGLLFVAVYSLSNLSGAGFLSWIATFLAFGLWFGQVSNSNAHELIHRSERGLYALGMWVYISVLFGHHCSAHRLVHHRFVATPDDPNTAAEGEGFYGFALRAWTGAFTAGHEMEEHLREGREAGGLKGLNPYSLYIAGALAVVAVMLTVFGFDGLLAYLLLCAHVQTQLLLSDYVQHYGLLRRVLPSGNLEPAGFGHSWDAPHPVSGLMMLNAPRHSDHHAHPSRRYKDLRLAPEARSPRLPYSLPVMATIALIPPLWFRVMNPRLAALRKATDGLARGGDGGTGLVRRVQA
ncbi:MAG: alkane 1-monooxygenase [Rhodobacteraceae bacterium]|nr:alkane 1-monooxygenase [Paracoccaceae bacterium]